MAIASLIGFPANDIINALNNSGYKHFGIDLYNQILAEALQKLPNYNIDIYRGEHFENKEEFNERIKGFRQNIISMTSFVSTTAEFNIAKDLYSRWEDDKTYSLVFRISPKTAKFIDPFVSTQANQFILLKGSKYKVLDIKFFGKYKKKCIATIEEI